MNLKSKLVKVWILTEMIFFLTFIPLGEDAGQEGWDSGRHMPSNFLHKIAAQKRSSSPLVHNFQYS